MNSLYFLPLLPFLLLSHCVVYSSESRPEDDYYTAHFPNGWNYTYNTAKSSNRSHWNKTRAAQEILDAHNEARKELNLTALEKSSQLEGYAREHAQLCGNNSEPDPFSVLPRLEGMPSLAFNLWASTDSTMTYNFTEVANHFYSQVAKKDYSRGYVPAVFDARYHELYAFLQVIQPDLSRLGCYGKRCDPIKNALRIPPDEYVSIRYLHWTYLVCYYANGTEPSTLSANITSKLSLPSPSVLLLPSQSIISSPPSRGTLSLQAASQSPPSFLPLPSPTVQLLSLNVLLNQTTQSLPSLNMLPVPIIVSVHVSLLLSPSVSPLLSPNTSPLPSPNMQSLISPSVLPQLNPSILPLPSPTLPNSRLSASLLPSNSNESQLPSKARTLSVALDSSALPLSAPDMSMLPSLSSVPLLPFSNLSPLPSMLPLQTSSSLPNPNMLQIPTLLLPTQSATQSISTSPSLLSGQLPNSKTALSSDHTNCSSSPSMLPLVVILSSLVLILCITLVLVPCLLIHYRKRVLLQIRDKKEHQGKSRRVKFNSGIPSDHNQGTRNNKMDMNIMYEAPASVNGSSVLYESVYLRTFFDESSVEDNPTTVITSHSYPITTSEQWTISDNQSFQIVHENRFAIQLQSEKAGFQYQHSLDLESSSRKNYTWSHDRKHL